MPQFAIYAKSCWLAHKSHLYVNETTQTEKIKPTFFLRVMYKIFHLLSVKANWSTTQEVFYGLKSVHLLVKFSSLAYYTSRSKGHHCSYCIWAMSMWHTWVRYINGLGVSFLTWQEQPIFSTAKSKERTSSGNRPGRVSRRVSAHIQV